MAGRLAIASAAAGAVILLIATIIAIVTMEMAKAAPAAGDGGLALVLGAALGFAVAWLLWVIGNIFMLVSYIKSRGVSSRALAGSYFLAAILHIVFLAGFMGMQSGMSLSTIMVALMALLLAIGYGVAGVLRLRSSRPEVTPTS